MANPLEGLPPNIQQFVMQMLGPEPEDPFADLLKQIEQQSGQARGAARDALGPLQALQGASMPQTSPGTDAMTELLGGLSQMLAPEMGGLQQARGARAGVEDDMQKRRLTRLATMEKHYDELAERADQLGNTELSLKMRAKAETFAAKQKRDAEARDLGTKLYEGQKDREGAMARTQVQEAGATSRAKLAEEGRLERAMQKIPGLMRHPDTGELVVGRGISERDFNQGVVDARKAMMNPKADKKAAKEMFRIAWTTPRRETEEALRPDAFIRRITGLDRNKSMGWTQKFLGNKPLLSPAEALDEAKTQYGLKLDTPEDHDAAYSLMRQAGFSSEEARKAVETLVRFYAE